MDNNLVVPILFETWDNPRWVGEEAVKYRNIVKDYEHSYFEKDLSMYSEEDRQKVISSFFFLMLGFCSKKFI